MIIRYVSIVLKLCSLGLVLGAGGLWASAPVDTRPKYRDEHTLVGGTLWSQTVIPLGLMISTIVDDHLDNFVHGYFLLSGVVLLIYTGTVLISDEYKTMQMRAQLREAPVVEARSVAQLSESYDTLYLVIGVLATLAGVFSFSELLLLMIILLITGLLAFGAYWTTKYLMNMPEAAHAMQRAAMEISTTTTQSPL